MLRLSASNLILIFGVIDLWMTFLDSRNCSSTLSRCLISVVSFLVVCQGRWTCLSFERSWAWFRNLVVFVMLRVLWWLSLLLHKNPALHISHPANNCSSNGEKSTLELKTGFAQLQKTGSLLRRTALKSSREAESWLHILSRIRWKLCNANFFAPQHVFLIEKQLKMPAWNQFRRQVFGSSGSLYDDHAYECILDSSEALN